ncbi:hypothetical protein HYE68_009722 [Fusarium pseudograminearum]|nr:hypothetical protein HYE68_009722 [Fusarium pseudograminearum]
MSHGILSNSVPSLLQFNSMEVYGYEDMRDSGVTYINVAQNLVSITYPDVSDDLQGLCEVSPWGPCRSSMPSSSYIYGKLVVYADFMKEEDIWPYNLHRIALKPNYNGSIRYREGIRCPGPCEALSCLSGKTITMANTILRRIGMKAKGPFYQPFMDLPMICETCGAIRVLIRSMFNSGRWMKPGSTHNGTCDFPDCQEPVALESQLCVEHALEMVDRSSVFTPVRKAVEKTLNRASTATIRQPQEALEFLSDPQRSYDGMSTEETEFIRDLNDQKDIYFTDSESVGNLLVQVSVVDSKGGVVFEGHINHGCSTVQEIWDLAVRCNHGKLAIFAETAL